MAPSIRKPHLHSSITRILSFSPRKRISISDQCPFREFSHSPYQASRARGQMWAWINGPGSVFREPLPGSTNYLGAYDKSGRLIRASERLAESRKEQKKDEFGGEDEEALADREGAGQQAKKEDATTRAQDIPPETLEDLMPFPLNPYFRSQSVLSDAFRNEIYRRVVSEGKTVREVSMSLGVEMSRVAAVVRLKTVEQNWVKEGNPLAKPYQAAIFAMVPLTNYNPRSRDQPRHESINDLPVHPATLHQLWHPTSESRVFTRADAGRAFHNSLLPADDRIPHPQMITEAREKAEGVGEMERARNREARLGEMEKAVVEAKRRVKEMESKRTRIVPGARWDFRFRDISVEDVGRNGRAVRGTGWRYGKPHDDRKRGQVRIPTRVV